MKPDMDQIVESRVLRQRHFQDWRRVVYRLRKLAAGDKSVVGIGVAQEEGQKPETEENLKAIPTGDEFPNVVPTTVDDGLSNGLWEMLKTFAMQVSYRMPEIDFENLSAEETMVNNAYLKRILGTGPHGCNAVDHMRLALLDYLIGATGFVWVSVDGTGKPSIEYVDCLTVTWDISNPILTDMEWVSRKVREPFWKWQEMFGAQAFADLNLGHDDLVELEWYYDRQGPDGHHYILHLSEGGRDGAEARVIEKGVNPFYATIGGQKKPFLPCEAMYFMQVPSVRFPMGLMQNMVAHQLPIWRMEENFREIAKRGKGYFAVEEGAMSDDDAKIFQQNKSASVIKVKPGKTPPVVVPGLEIRQTDMAFYQHHQAQMQRMSGANPYSGGGRVDGVEFASEVQEIAAAASLTAGVVSKDHAEHWQGVIRKVLYAGALYDTNPYSFHMDGVDIQFDPAQFPIRLFLQPEADVVVRENSGAFKPRRDAIIEASQDIEVALKLANVFPNMLAKAAEGYVRARGVENVTGYLFGQQSESGGAGQVAAMEQSTQ